MKKYSPKPFNRYLVCVEHGIFDSYPCPWPNCPNGIGEDSFSVDSFIKDKPPQIHYRRRWNSSIDSNYYYSWEIDNYPLWFSAKNILWNQARRLGLLKEQNNNLVFHYTNLTSLVGIIESKTIWLSDYSYLNDARELIHGREIVANVADEITTQYNSNKTKSLLNSWHKSALNSKQRVCIASFSSDSDSLSQWRAYGSVAIGFSPNLLSMHANHALLAPVNYDYSIQKKLIKVYLNHLIQSYEADLSKNLIDQIPDIYHRFGQILEVIAFFKDSSFKDEQEYRLVYVEHPELEGFADLKLPPKRFRIYKNRIIPYVVSSEVFPNPHEEKFRELGISLIVLGPGSDTTLESGLREFLDSNKMYNVVITKSNVPYRT